MSGRLDSGYTYDESDAKVRAGRGSRPRTKTRPEHADAVSAMKNGDVRGQKVDNQPFDLAVEVNDSEEIDSDEEEDEVHVGAT